MRKLGIDASISFSFGYHWLSLFVNLHSWRLKICFLFLGGVAVAVLGVKSRLLIIVFVVQSYRLNYYWTVSTSAL